MSPNATTRFTRNWLVNIVLLTSFVGWLAACEEPKEIGLTPTTPVGVLYTDTLTIRTSTVLLDSVQTDRATRLLVGRYNDPAFGQVTARAFTQLFLSGDSLKAPADYIYDSLRIEVDYAYAYGDTTRPQEIFVHRVTEDLDTNRRYTNTSSAAFSPMPLARLRIKGPPTTTRVVARMSDSFGQEIFNLAKGNGIEGSSLRNQLKGLAFVPGAANTSIIGIGSFRASTLAFYAHKPGDTVSSVLRALYISPYIGFDNQFRDRGLGRHSAFSQISSDRMGTRLADLSVSKPLPATTTGGETFVQGGTGITTKIEFPTLLNLKKQGRVAVNRAELTITVAEPGAGGAPPTFMALGAVDGNNRLKYGDAKNFLGFTTRYYDLLQRDLVNLGTATPPERFSSPQLGFYNTRTRSYTFQITSYLQKLLTDAAPNEGLALLPTNTSNGGVTIPVNTRTLSGAALYAGEIFLNNLVNSAVLRNNGSAKSVKLVVFYTLAK